MKEVINKDVNFVPLLYEEPLRKLHRETTNGLQ